MHLYFPFDFSIKIGSNGFTFQTDENQKAMVSLGTGLCINSRFRSSHQRCSVRKGVRRNFTKFTGKHLCQSLFFDKVAGMRSATFLKNRLWQRCFPVSFVKFLSTPFSQNTSWRLLLPFIPQYFSLIFDLNVTLNDISLIVHVSKCWWYFSILQSNLNFWSWSYLDKGFIDNSWLYSFDNDRN